MSEQTQTQKLKTISDYIRDMPFSKPWMEVFKDLNQVHISFWTDDLNDGEATLNFHIDMDEMKETEEYGITDELIYWMNDNNDFEAYISYQHNHEEGDEYRTFVITDEIIAKWLLEVQNEPI